MYINNQIFMQAEHQGSACNISFELLLIQFVKLLA
jgi:hypothetical protein